MSSALPVFRPKTPADLQRAREQIGWIDDDDLRELERKSAGGAAALSGFTWGCGNLMIGDYAKGAALIAGLFGWIAVASNVMPDPIGGLVYVGVGAVSALFTYRKARARNRFVAIRDELVRAEQGQGQPPAAYRLLAAAAVVDPHMREELARAQAQLAAGAAAPGGGFTPATPSKHQPLLDTLRKLARLRAAGVINDTELKDRQIDLLTAAAPATRAELDDLMFELLPLADEAVLTSEDFDFLKRLG